MASKPGYVDGFSNHTSQVDDIKFGVPIACNTGTEGQGKMTQLQLLRHDFMCGDGLFDEPGEARISVYVT